MSNNRLIILSELYYPEDTSTGYFLTGIAEGLSKKSLEVIVICSKPNYRGKYLEVVQSEFHNGVQIQRIKTFLGDKDNFFKRIWNVLIQSWYFYRELKTMIRSDDKILVVTNPPTLPWIVSLMKCTDKSNHILLIHDVYPDVFVPTGYLSRNNLIFRFLNKLQNKILKSFGHIVVLGRDMKSLVEKKIRESESKISIIENWGDVNQIKARSRERNTLRKKLGISNKFVIQFSGNIGRTHGVADLISLARYLSSEKQFHFFVFGDGAAKNEIESKIESGELINMTLMNSCERHELDLYLNTCDLFFLSLKKGMEGISVPSRMYNVMAAGNPILAVTDASSELAMVVKEENIGWIAPAGNIKEMANVVHEAFENPEVLQGMRVRARKAVEQKYSKEIIINKFCQLINKL